MDQQSPAPESSHSTAQQKYDQALKKRGPTARWNLWRNSFLLSAAAYSGVIIYQLGRGVDYSINHANAALADTAIILIGLSFALSGICYFWDFFDTKIIYRKYLGITGFAYALAHGLIAYFLYFVIPNDQSRYDALYVWEVFGFQVNNAYAFLFGATALLILLFMASISNTAGMKRYGQRWRPLLRLGYLAYFLALLHYGIKRYEVWEIWLTERPSVLPPFSLLLTAFVLLVFILRLALLIKLRLVKQRGPDKQSL
ncbi:MAG: hypothetical protein Q8Q20_05525 [bacterium]|nr:hypothetical protein [bacterium]